MMMMAFSEREQVVEVLNRLFHYTDHRKWDGLVHEVFAEEVHMDMTSLGAPEAELMKAQEICDMWRAGFEGLDAIHHQPGGYMIDLNGDKAEAKCYAIASHYQAEATKGQTREFVGSYDFKLQKNATGWRITFMKYKLKYTRGNMTLE